MTTLTTLMDTVETLLNDDERFDAWLNKQPLDREFQCGFIKGDINPDLPLHCPLACYVNEEIGEEMDGNIVAIGAESFAVAPTKNGAVEALDRMDGHRHAAGARSLPGWAFWFVDEVDDSIFPTAIPEQIKACVVVARSLAKSFGEKAA